MLEQARSTGDTGLENALMKFTLDTPSALDPSYMAIRTEGMNKLGIGLKHKRASILWDAAFPVLRCRAYTFWQKINYVRGMNFSQTHLWDRAATDVLIDSVPVLEIPVYIIQGVHDYQTSYEEARAFFDQLQAPEKHFYSFEDSAHSPPFEEPERFMQLLQEDVLGTSLQ
jgi:pimeloyl-ACP methyl ester carboxylesterase